MDTTKNLIDFYEALEGPMERLVERCNNAGDLMSNAEEVIAAEAALEKLHRARLSTPAAADAPEPVASIEWVDGQAPIGSYGITAASEPVALTDEREAFERFVSSSDEGYTTFQAFQAGIQYVREELALMDRRPDAGYALSQFRKYEAEAGFDIEIPLERLRFFLSMALSPQDWLDVEEFLDALPKASATEPVALTDLIERLKAQAAAHRYMAETESAALIDEAVVALAAHRSQQEAAQEPVSRDVDERDLAEFLADCKKNSGALLMPGWYGSAVGRLIQRMKRSLDFYRQRVELLQTWQQRMRDPERTIVCDILANGQTLPDSDGKRYGQASTAPSESEARIPEGYKLVPAHDPLYSTRRDAERYRWLRRGGYSIDFARSVLIDTPHGIDAAIDAAIGQSASGQKGEPT